MSIHMQLKYANAPKRVESKLTVRNAVNGMVAFERSQATGAIKFPHVEVTPVGRTWKTYINQTIVTNKYVIAEPHPHYTNPQNTPGS